MNQRNASLWVMISVGCILGLLVNGFSSERASAQAQTGQGKVQWEKIGVTPFFKGRRSTDTGESLSCPICELSFQSGSILTEADKTLTRYVQKSLEARYGEKVIPLEVAIKVYKEIPQDDTKDTPRSLARKVGEALNVNFIIVGTVWRYRDRPRDDVEAQRGASVAFDVYLIEVSSGKTVWKAKFDETQRPLTEDVRGAKVLLKKGAKWLSADELARYGVGEVFKKFPL
jgi:hypothetical protein